MSTEHRVLFPHFRLCVALVFAALFWSSQAAAATWFVRVDGGDPAHCNGQTNAPYSATIAGKACAISHLMYLLPPNRDGNDVGRKPLIAGSDTVMIAAGAYQFGLPFNGGPWGSCSSSWVYDCHMQPVPSGTAANPTRIIGAGSALTSFWGSGGASFVVNLSGSSNVVIQGIEITDHSNCVQNHTAAAVRCQAGGLWAATGISDTEGGTDTPASSNVTLTDVLIHGMGKFGLLAGHIDGWTLTSVRIIGNGFGGWSLDTGASPSSGTNAISNVEIAYNGCTENYPAPTIYACWGQQTGGYGDGIGSSSASDQGTWNFSQVSVHDNVQDGIDFLHANPSAIVNLDHIDAERNAGNQVKGNGTVTLSNSTVNGDCSALQGKGNMVGDNSKGGQTSGDNCRADGDAVVFSLSSNHTVTMTHNTVLSQGGCIITVADISSTNLSTGDATSKIVATNNILIGFPGWVFNPDLKQSCIYYWNAENTGQYKTNLAMTSNVIWNAGGTIPTGNLVVDPKLANETLAGFDPTPTAATPPNVGAIASSGPVTPPSVACSGGVVENNACYCPASTTANAGGCAPLPKACVPTVSCAGSPSAQTCTPGCAQ